MERKEDFQLFPWSSYDEFRSVATIILNLEFNSNLLNNIDFLKDLQWTERQLTIWRTKTNSTQHLYEVDATHSIVNCLIHEFLPKLSKINSNQSIRPTIDNSNNLVNEKSNDLTNEKSNDLTNNKLISTTEELPVINSSLFSSPFFNLINEETLSCLYSNSVLKFFKMLSYYDIIDGRIERLLSRSESNLVKICERLDFPQYIIEYRHRIAHNKLPSFDQLRLAVQIALSWIKIHYWSKYLSLLQSQEKTKVQIYEQTTIVLTNLLEEDADKRTQSDKKEKINKRPLKKQKLELKRFNVLDKKQVNILNDTLYDLLNVDFYSTLHEITLYIVNSTKEHLEKITVEQIKQWIQKDENSFNLVLNCFTKEINNEQKNNFENRKKEQLIPSFILNSFKPIFEIINGQLSSINQLLFYLHLLIEDQKMDLKISAQVWFVQILCSLLNNLKFSEQPFFDKNRLNILTEFEKCFRLSGTQLIDLKWLHLFTMLVEQPIMGKINLCLAKRFYPLISFGYSKVKFDQICSLLSIYLDVNEDLNENSMGRKKKSILSNEDSLLHNYFDFSQLEPVKTKEVINLDISLTDANSSDLGVSLIGKTEKSKDLGIFVKSKLNGSFNSKLEVDDQIISINGISLSNLTNEIALGIFKRILMNDKTKSLKSINLSVVRFTDIEKNSNIPSNIDLTKFSKYQSDQDNQFKNIDWTRIKFGFLC